MAEGWGNQVHHWQAYVEASVTSETATTATITCKTYWHSISWGYSYYGHGYGVIGSTTGSDSGTVVFSSGTGASVYQLLTTMTKTVNKTGSAQTITCKGVAILTGDSSGTRNGTSTATCTVTVSAIAYEAPNSPTSCSASRSSDTKATVTWANGDVTTTRPRDNNYIERSTDGGSWTQIANIAGTTANYTDNGISANHRYAYRVRSGNSAGKSGYATSGYIYTTPAAPASVTVSKTAATTVQVGITGAAPYATGYDVARKSGSADFVRLASNAAMPYTDSSVPAGTVQYAARAVRGSLVSAWTFAEAIVTVTAPLAPTITAHPANPSVLGWTVPVRWTPNHPDGSAQTSAQVEITKPDGTTSTVTVSGTATETSIELTQAGTWTARVRTHGLYDGWGAWSSSVSWGVYERPVVVITSPATDGTVVDTLPLGIAWKVTDPTGVSSQTVTLSDASTGATVWEATVPSGTSSVEVHASDAPSLANGTAYALTVAVIGGSGLSASAVREFATDWAAPAVPTATVTIDPTDLSASVTAFGNVTYDLGEGESLAVREGGMLASLTIHGKSVQDGTPSPSSPVAIKSVEATNLLDYDAWKSVGITNGTAVFENNGVTLTASANDCYTVTAVPTAARVPVTEGEVIYLTWDSPDTYSGYCYIFPNGTTSGMKSSNNSDARFVQYTVGAGVTYITYRVGVATAGNTIHYENIRITKTRATEYAPKGSISVRSSRNLFNGISVAQNVKDGVTWSYDADSNRFKASGTSAIDNNDLRIYFKTPITVPEGVTSLTFSFDGTFVGSNAYFFMYDNANGWSYKGITSAGKCTFTDMGGHAFSFCMVRTYTNSGNISIDATIQVEYGTEATEHALYSPAAAYIDLKGNAVRSLPDGTEDTLVIDGEGNVTLTQKVGMAVIDGTNIKSSSVLAATGDGVGVRHHIGLLADADTSVAKCPVFYSEAFYPDGDILTSSKLRVGMGWLYPYSSTVNFMAVLPSDCTTAALGNDWFAANPVEVLYPLATPQIISLGTVDMPYADAGSTVSVDAAVTPTISGTIKMMEYAGQPETDHLMVTRVGADGTRWVVASGMASGDTCIDPLPPLGVQYAYEVTASAETGATSATTYTEQLPACRWAVNYGRRAEVCYLLGRNPEDKGGHRHGGERYHFAGRGLPVWYPTDQRDSSGSLDFEAEDLWQLNDFMRTARASDGLAWLRDPWGNRWLATVEPDWSRSRRKRSITIAWDAVEFEEAW